MVLHPSVDGLFLLMPVYGCLLNPIKFSAFLIWMTIASNWQLADWQHINILIVVAKIGFVKLFMRLQRTGLWNVCMKLKDEMIDTKRAMLNRDHLVGRLTRGKESNEHDLVFNCCQMIKDETLAVAMDQKPLYTEEIDHIMVVQSLCIL